MVIANGDTLPTKPSSHIGGALLVFPNSDIVYPVDTIDYYRIDMHFRYRISQTRARRSQRTSHISNLTSYLAVTSTTALPTFSPLINLQKAAGAVSSPTVLSCGIFSRPSST